MKLKVLEFKQPSDDLNGYLEGRFREWYTHFGLVSFIPFTEPELDQDQNLRI